MNGINNPPTPLGVKACRVLLCPNTGECEVASLFLPVPTGSDIKSLNHSERLERKVADPAEDGPRRERLSVDKQSVARAWSGRGIHKNMKV